MIIDVHVHPVLFGPICTDSDRVNFRKKAFGLYKSSPVPMEQVMAVMDHAAHSSRGSTLAKPIKRSGNNSTILFTSSFDTIGCPIDAE